MTDLLPVVLVHGIRLSGGAWRVVAAQLERQRPVLAVDLPGHGTRRGERFTLSGASETVLEGIDRLGGRALVVGHSLGGYVSIAAAANAPERIAGLVVAGATCVPNRLLTSPFSLMHRMLSTQPDGGERISGRIFDAALPGEVARAVKDGGIATEVIPDVVHELTAFDVLGALADYPGPVWLVNGGHDHLRLHERRFAGACAHGRLNVVPGAGHYLPLTRPQEFSRTVLDAAAAAEASALE
ncbi:alpha/beta fold hydrolase [Nocardia yamanashiensis]|uniref:alpha/beta fold hydrolase n=1 Tax=Nocardia yamanashiensis TaxID=209247 RepID=UPI0008338197|nr:alpha/beta hydrolase [Nocardia yamanashiensis]